MPLEASSLLPHPDGKKVRLIDPFTAGYVPTSKWRDRYCGNCGWFVEQPIEDLPDVTGDEHPQADGKGTVHRCAYIGSAIAQGGYCENWGTDTFEAPGQTEV